MKGVPIKFRGKSIMTDDYVYGDLIHGFDDEGKYSENVTGIVFNNELNEISRVKIYPNSVSQLCGYDANGNEVYEGDRLVEITNAIITTAHLYPNTNFKNYNIRRK